MKEFTNKKRIFFIALLAITLTLLILLLIAPIGTIWNGFWIYTPSDKEFKHCVGAPQKYFLTSPFTLSIPPYQSILVEQTVVFTLVSIVFVVFTVLFAIELKRAGVFNRTRNLTSTERMQAQIDELQKQVDELKQDK